MDVQLYARVLWRFRLLVLFGLVLAFALSLLSMARMSFADGAPKFEYRDDELWSSHATLLVTQTGFPIGRSVYDEVIQVGKGEQSSVVPRFNSVDHFAHLAVVYSKLATSDQVRRSVRRDVGVRGLILANPVVNEASGSVLPMIDLSGNASTPEGAVLLAKGATDELRGYIEEQQDRNRIRDDRRIKIQVLNEAAPPALVTARSRTRPIFIFLTVMIAVIGLAFLLENLSPRSRPVATEAPATPEAVRRRSA